MARISGRHRLALKEIIAANAGHDVAEEKMIEKRDRTAGAFVVLIVGLGLAALCWFLAGSAWATIGFTAAACFGAGSKQSPEYTRALVKDLADFIRTLGGALTSAKKGGDP